MYCKFGPRGNSDCEEVGTVQIGEERESCNKCPTKLRMLVKKANELGKLHAHVERLYNELTSLKTTTEEVLEKWRPEDQPAPDRDETNLKQIFNEAVAKAKAEAFDALNEANRI